MPGTLYLCATPIGNLGDMTPRVVETLQTVDVIAAEDTRNSIKLLNHFDIHTPMTSYHEYNKVEKAHQLVGQLLNGQNIALITDAGTPAISMGKQIFFRQVRCMSRLNCWKISVREGFALKDFCLQIKRKRK